MKKILILLLLILPLYIAGSIYLLDKQDFLCPLEYSGDIIIRSDSRGNGLFASPRNGRRLHQGIDLYAPVGTPVLVARSGKVIAATRNNGMGKYVIIRHSGNLVTLYGHLDQIYVRKGAWVRQGCIIGSVGKTGNAKFSGIESHLHFEVRYNGIPQDPLGYL